MKNIHASCVSISQKGVLIIGASGRGKSDLSLRLIQNKGACLVADDRVELDVKDSKVIARSPETLKGLLEVRGVGICRLPYQPRANLALVVELVDRQKIERLPQNEIWTFENISIPLLRVDPFEASVIDKIVIKLNARLI